MGRQLRASGSRATLTTRATLAPKGRSRKYGQCGPRQAGSYPEADDQGGRIRTLRRLLTVPCLADELQSIAVEVGNVRGVIAGGEIRTVAWLALVDAACLDRSCVGGIDSLVIPADNAEVETGLSRLALPEPDARPDPLASAVDVVTESEQVRDALGTGCGTVAAALVPAEWLQGFRVEGKRILDIGHRDV